MSGSGTGPRRPGAGVAGTGTDVAGTGADVAGTGTGVGGTGADVAGAGTDVAGTGAGVGGTGADVAGTGADVAGTGTGVGGTGADVAGAGTDVAGTGAGVGGTGADVAGTGADVAGTGAGVGGTGADNAGTGASVGGTGAGVGGTGADVAGTGADVAGTGADVAGTGAGVGGTGTGVAGTGAGVGGTGAGVGGTGTGVAGTGAGVAGRATSLRALVGRRLERGEPGSGPTRLAAAAWAAWSARTVARPLQLPRDVRLIGIGGAVLGGAGKTPVAIAVVRALAALGDPPALVGHAYRARPGKARVVGVDDAVGAVGDDALAAARLLHGAAPVIVAPSRRAAVEHAAALGHRVIVVDGLLQTSPVRLAAAVLVLDGTDPWGSGACPPLGDLRAPRAALLGAADLVVALQPDGTDPDPSLPTGAISISGHLDGAVAPTGEALSLDALRRLRLGLLLAVARPARIVAALARAGIRPEVTVLLGDHAIPSAGELAQAGRAPVEGWLTTARCATKLGAAIGGRPVLALEHRVEVGELVSRLATRAGG